MAEKDRERLIERITKLMALAGNNPSEAEAAAAMERASALLTEHNLTMAEIEDFGAEGGRVEERYQNERASQSWARVIWAHVADLNFCFWCYYQRSRRGGPLIERLPGARFRIVDGYTGRTDVQTIVGTKANVTVTKLMAVYLVETVERLARECEDARGTHEKHAFKLGCARRLRARLRALKVERMKAAGPPTQVRTGSALPTLASVYERHDQANRELFEQHHGDTPGRYGTRLGTRNVEAYASGYRAGGGVNLDPQVAKRSSIKALPGGVT